MNTLLLTAGLLLRAEDTPKRPPSGQPSTIVIKVKGAVTRGRE